MSDYPRPAVTRFDPYRGDPAWGVFQAALSGAAAFWALGGCLTDELSPPGARVLAHRLIEIANVADPMADVRLTGCFALALLVLSGTRLVAGLGIAWGRRWGFSLSAAVSIVLGLAGIAALPDLFAAFGAAFGSVSAAYALRRLAGKDVSRFA